MNAIDKEKRILEKEIKTISEVRYIYKVAGIFCESTKIKYAFIDSTQ